MPAAVHADPEKPRPTAVAAGRVLRSTAVVVLVLNVIATIVAIVLNLPSQFGIVGTDAGSEFLSSGTAISAPVPPVVALLIVAAFAGRADRWRWLGIAAGYASALMMGIGGYGELVGKPTEDTSRAVLVGSGIVFLTIAFSLTALSTAAAVLRRSTGRTEARSDTPAPARDRSDRGMVEQRDMVRR